METGVCYHIHPWISFNPWSRQWEINFNPGFVHQKYAIVHNLAVGSIISSNSHFGLYESCIYLV